MGITREGVSNDPPSCISRLLKNRFNKSDCCLMWDQRRRSSSDRRQWRLCKKLLLFLQARRQIQLYTELLSEQDHPVRSFPYRFGCLQRSRICSFTESFCMQFPLNDKSPHPRDCVGYLLLCWLSNELSIQLSDAFAIALIRRFNEMKDDDLFLNSFFIPLSNERMKLFIKTDLCI